ncbi:sensor histidine kinase [Pontiella agarivorans]|uniref:histidine kinase n=1 Tax=Pontiella agarivorans TaxID=3038953 RepID=A0ABU5MZR5_9BACT|nr:ATP-binding protein [Pontiella agarivorans]MDZ8119709.1 histidine kinase dimerization/phospho-acceptor domain-containing protein [Pontiella agarivorans]
MSLRNRIAFYFVAVTALSTAILFLVIYGIVHNTVYTHLNKDLEAECAEVANSIVYIEDELIFANTFEWSEQEHAQIEVNPTFIQVVDPSGKNLRKTVNLRNNNLEFHPHATRKAFYDLLVAGASVRQIQAPLRPDNGPIQGYLIVAIPFEESARVLSNLRYILLISFPTVLLFLFAVSRMIAGRIISPVNTVIATADLITRENMNERIPVPPRKDELYKLSETINRLLDRLQEAVVREKQFTADASHELRNPISVIRGTLEVLIRKQREPGHYEEKIEYVIGEVDRMAALVEQLLTLARSENGLRPMMGPVDLKLSTETALGHFRESIAEKNISVKCGFHGSDIINADAAMTGIILENLISNAVKYSCRNGIIQVQTIRGGNHIELSVTNFGHGIPQPQLNRVFDRFYRIDECRSSHLPGTGLGLAIVRRLVDLQDFSISADSSPEHGTTFRIGFPAA